jgi:oxygen-independent coproporphyrinogen-3 oxidase
MAGIYIHIPFCKSRCIYCDFYSGVQTALLPGLIDALCIETESRVTDLNGEAVKTIYFGGGTPSLLQKEHFERLFDVIRRTYGMEDCAEITLEANPDDLTDDYLRCLSELPFNRISVGIQSFDDGQLKMLGRRHSARQAYDVVEKCKRYFSNISIDLMYGLPGQTLESWKHTISTAVALNIQHVSAYHLTYEPGTGMERMLASGTIRAVGEETSVQMYGMLAGMLHEAGFVQYEISNFARNDCFSKHNSSYWQGIPYVGVGPSAHSFAGDKRRWNIADTPEYIRKTKQGIACHEEETLTEDDKYNELLMLSLRTIRGLALDEVERRYGEQRVTELQRQCRPFIGKGAMTLMDGILRMTPEGWFISDGILAELFI